MALATTDIHQPTALPFVYFVPFVFKLFPHGGFDISTCMLVQVYDGGRAAVYSTTDSHNDR
jgi:hypothetical protein